MNARERSHTIRKEVKSSLLGKLAQEEFDTIIAEARLTFPDDAAMRRGYLWALDDIAQRLGVTSNISLKEILDDPTTLPQGD